MADLAAVGFGEVRDEGANAGTQRNHSITARDLNVAARRVRNDQPILTPFLHQSAFSWPRRDGLSHPQWSQDGVIDAGNHGLRRPGRHLHRGRPETLQPAGVHRQRAGPVVPPPGGPVQGPGRLRPSWPRAERRFPRLGGGGLHRRHGSGGGQLRVPGEGGEPARIQPVVQLLQSRHPGGPMTRSPGQRGAKSGGQSTPGTAGCGSAGWR